MILRAAALLGFAILPALCQESVPTVRGVEPMVMSLSIERAPL